MMYMVSFFVSVFYIKLEPIMCIQDRYNYVISHKFSILIEGTHLLKNLQFTSCVHVKTYKPADETHSVTRRKTCFHERGQLFSFGFNNLQCLFSARLKNRQLILSKYFHNSANFQSQTKDMIWDFV